jgi:SecD/SecF fusion protein
MKQSQDLPIKLAALAVVVAVCILLLFNKGLKLGIDLRGGHSLTFQIRTNADEVNRLKTRQIELEAKIAKATNDEEKKVLVETSKRLEGDLAQAQKNEATDSSLAEDMIRILKERVDPLGLRMLEWRPVGANRFEVRMPAGNPETQEAKNAFRRAIQALESRIIERSHLRGLEQGRTTIEKLAGSDKKLAGLLGEMLSAYKTLDQKRKAGETKIQQYIGAWEVAETDVLKHNIQTQALRSILSGYVRPSDLRKLRNKPKALAALEGREDIYNRAIDTFLEKHKDNTNRTAAIKEVIELYKTWANRRQELEDPSDLMRLITKAGALEFRIAPVLAGNAVENQEALPLSERDRYVKILRDTLDKEGPQGLARRTDRYMWFPIRGDRKSGYASMVTYTYGSQKYLLLSNFKGRTLLQRRDENRWALTNAYWASDEKGLPAVGFSMDDAGAKFLYTLTLGNKGEHMAILLDNEVYSAPVIRNAISSSGIITMGTFNSEEVDSLIKILRAGSLPAKLIEVPVAESSFGPTFGEANRTMGLRAGIIGMILVVIFMCFYYRIPGVIAVTALTLNIVLVLGVMSLIGAVFTLPGIAGIILTIGIAVDANVLIFEECRRQQIGKDRGAVGLTRGVRGALNAAYRGNYSVIFDANITTVMVCFILGWFGSEEVRGFAITLAFGVIFSMFTALVVTRWMFLLLLERGFLSNTKPLNMYASRLLQWLVDLKIEWMEKRHYFWGFSGIVIVISLVSLWVQGKKMLGIEFSSGTQAVITFKDDALIDGELPYAELVRSRFMKHVETLSGEDREQYGKLAETSKIETRYDYKKVDRFVKPRDSDGDGKITRKEFEALPRANVKFFEIIDTNSDNELSGDELQGLPETSYQITTTEVSVPLISKTATETFGTSLKRRISYPPQSDENANGYVVIKDAVITELDLEANSDGYAEVHPRNATAHASTLEDFSDGVVIAVRRLLPKMTKRELQERIENTQLQPGFAERIQNRVKVVALTGTAGGEYSDFAVFSRPGQTSQSTEAVAADLSELLTASLHRDEAIVAINFDAAIASGAAQLAIFAFVASCLCTVAYIGYRFGGMDWGVAAVICLIHDVVIVAGFMAAAVWLDTALGGALGTASFKIDLAVVAAFLTVIGYSINDTIVVFAQIRRRRLTPGRLDLSGIRAVSFNGPINEVIPRTIITSVTTFIVVAIMYGFGGDAIHPFSFALMVGVVFGTYSSIAVASTLLYAWGQRHATQTITVTKKKKA